MKLFQGATKILIIAVVAAGISGCVNGDIRRYCKEAVDCEDGNDEDEKACRAEWKGYYKVAKAYGCGSEFRDYMDCMEEKSKCEDSYGSSYYTSNGKCNDEGEDLWECEEDASGYNDSGDDYYYY
jgi:hypothetical protein